MQLHKAPEPPSGRTQFNILLSGKPKPISVSLKSFMWEAQKYDSGLLAQTLSGMLSYESADLQKKVYPRSSKTRKILLNDRLKLTGCRELFSSLRQFVEARNSKILSHFLLSQKSGSLGTPYQAVCKELVTTSSPRERSKCLDTLGVFGNLLPADEKQKLGEFLIDFMCETRGVQAKTESMKALVELLFPGAVDPIMFQADGIRNRALSQSPYDLRSALILEHAAYKSSIILYCLNNPSWLDNPSGLAALVSVFTYGGFSLVAKTDSARMLESIAVWARGLGSAEVAAQFEHSPMEQYCGEVMAYEYAAMLRRNGNPLGGAISYGYMDNVAAVKAIARLIGVSWAATSDC